MENVRSKLLIPTILVVVFCLGVIAYISHQQYSAFRTSARQTTMQRAHEMQRQLLAIQARNQELIEVLSNNWAFIDHVALASVKDLLDLIVPFQAHRSLDLINVYSTDGTLLACAENPGLFGHEDDISPLLAGKETGAAIQPVALVHDGRLGLVAIKRIEGNYGPIGFLAVGRYLSNVTLADFTSRYHEEQGGWHFRYQGKEYLTLGGRGAAGGRLQKPKSTAISFPPEVDGTGGLTALLVEDISRAEQDFWNRTLAILLVFVFFSLLVIGFSRRITLAVANDLERSRDELEVRVRERTVELSESEERFRMLVNSLDSLVYVADMDSYEMLFINSYGEQIWGDVVGKTCWQALQAGQSGPCTFCTNARLLDDDGKPSGTYVWEFQNTVDDEWYECRDQAIRWPDGRYVRMEIATNITQRKQTAISLAEEKERLAVTLRSIGDGVITTDTSGRIVLINKIAEQLTGWSSQEAAGRPLAEVFRIVNEITREPCENPVEKVLASGKIIGLANHTVLISREGEERSIADSGAPIRDRESKIIGVVLVFRDITDQLRTEQELAKVKKLESIAVLAGGIAHDFNNILAAILGNIDLAMATADLAPKTEKLLTEAQKASLRARDLTQQLLTFAKGGEPVKETASLADVVRESANFVLHGDKVACRYFFDDDLWLVDIDKGQISQVVQNIILNASQAMPLGGTIEVRGENVLAADEADLPVRREGKFVKLTIQDCGIGIPANIVDKIFDPYFSTKQQGSGLGLAITHSIVSKHDGHITVKSVPGEGTTFTIYLPSRDRGAMAEKREETARPALRKARILVLDDDAMVREIVLGMLRQMGHTAEAVQNGEEAIRLYGEALASGDRFDLVIMDLTIPGGMGGEIAVREILAIEPQAKVIVSSGYSTDPIMAAYKEYGFCGVLVKPYQYQELAKAVNEVLGDTAG